MKTSIKKLSFLLLSLIVFFSSCKTDDNLKIIAPTPEFALQQPSISNIFLNYGLPTNPAFTIVWKDGVTGSSSYTVEMATDNDFTVPINLGNSDTKTFSMNIKDFNTAITSTGITTFRDIPIYMRVNGGDKFTNTVMFLVTTYPSNPPLITSPEEASTFPLSLSTADDVAINIKWTDDILKSTLGLDVSYTVEAALDGTDFATPISIGSVNNKTSISKTHADFNSIALGAGLIAGTAGKLNIRVKATITNTTNQVLERISTPITVSVTPYNVSFPNLFFVGDATAPGWDNNNNNNPIFRDPNTPNKYVYTGYFAAGAFKLLEVKGQWHPQWGTNDGTTLAVNRDDSSDPGTFNVTTAGYYTYSFTTAGTSGSFTASTYDASSAPTYTTIGVIGDSTPGGWNTDTDMTKSSHDPHIWYVKGITLTNGDFKFRAENAWTINWGYDTDNATELYGTALINNGNIPVTAGTYDIWFNDLTGRYIFISN